MKYYFEQYVNGRKFPPKNESYNPNTERNRLARARKRGALIWDSGRRGTFYGKVRRDLINQNRY